MKQRYQSPAWISAALDDAGLTPHEFRVLAHVCRRAGDGSNGRGCDASVASMAAVCGFDVKTVRSSLHRLVALGWLEAVERRGKPTEYLPRFGPDAADYSADPSRSTVGVEDPYHEMGGHPYHPTVGDPYRSTVAKGIPEGNPLRETRNQKLEVSKPREKTGNADDLSTTEPTETTGHVPEVCGSDVRQWARQIYTREIRTRDAPLAAFPLEEVEIWAMYWLSTMQACGWQLDGARVANPHAALRGYLMGAAAGHSKAVGGVFSG